MPKSSRPANPLALAVLALLFERPMHPYEMAALMQERGKHDSIKLRYGSLYTVIDLLVARGLITPQSTERAGGRPQRTVYELSPAGRSVLHDWMRDLIGQPVNDFPQFEAGLSLLPVLPPDEAVTLLRERLARLDAMVADRAGQLAARPRQFPEMFVVEGEFRLAMLRAESEFVKNLLRRIAEEEWGPLHLWRGFHDDREATLAAVAKLVEAAFAEAKEPAP
jgi:DNA-binding PadR family transcriptional regulator